MSHPAFAVPGAGRGPGRQYTVGAGPRVRPSSEPGSTRIGRGSYRVFGLLESPVNAWGHDLLVGNHLSAFRSMRP